MTLAEFFFKASKSARQSNFPNKEAEERAMRDMIYRGLDSQRVKDRCINSYNNAEEISIEFLMKHLEVGDSNIHHKSLNHLDFTAKVSYMCYDQRQSRGNKHAKNHRNGKPVAQKHGKGSKSRILTICQEFLQTWRESVSCIGKTNTKRGRSVQHMGRSARPVAS